MIKYHLKNIMRDLQFACKRKYFTAVQIKNQKHF